MHSGQLLRSVCTDLETGSSVCCSNPVDIHWQNALKWAFTPHEACEGLKLCSDVPLRRHLRRSLPGSAEFSGDVTAPPAAMLISSECEKLCEWLRSLKRTWQKCLTSVQLFKSKLPAASCRQNVFYTWIHVQTHACLYTVVCVGVFLVQQPVLSQNGVKNDKDWELN